MHPQVQQALTIQNKITRIIGKLNVFVASNGQRHV